jgi:uncharacterized protein (TIGR03790 family)
LPGSVGFSGTGTEVLAGTSLAFANPAVNTSRNWDVRVTGLVTICLICFGLCSTAAPAAAQSGANVLVLANASNPASVQIAEHYARARSIPADNVIALKTLPAEAPDVISRPAYERLIELPIAEWLGRHSAHDRILYIVLTKGIPLRVEGSLGRKGTQASVDSELTLLYRTLTGRPVAPHGHIENPYFSPVTPAGEFKQFTHKDYDIFLVTRLDGFSVADVIAMIDRGGSPTRDGRILFDQRAALDDPGNTWLREAADRLTKDGFGSRVVLESTSRTLADEPNVLGYFSWGSNDPAVKGRSLNLGFVPGALAATFVSTDARTFNEPPADWSLGKAADRKTHFAGSPESLTGDLVRQGATGVAGHVAEPFFDAVIRPDRLFSAYLSGLNLAEAFYVAMPYLSWHTVVLGDPLCAPFRASSPDASELDPPTDPETERQPFFSGRRLVALGGKGLRKDALKLLLQGEARLGRGDQSGGRQALEAAALSEARLVEAQLQLAALHDRAREFDQAIDRYRQVIANEPRNSVALNNLAYNLAVHKNVPADALPFAEKARLLAPGNPLIVDTLGWVHHLAGNHREALRFLVQAGRGASQNPDIRLHLASAFAAAGQFEAAQRELAVALKLEPDLEHRSNLDVDVSELRKKIDASTPRTPQNP